MCSSHCCYRVVKRFFMTPFLCSEERWSSKEVCKLLLILSEPSFCFRFITHLNGAHKHLQFISLNKFTNSSSKFNLIPKWQKNCQSWITISLRFDDFFEEKILTFWPLFTMMRLCYCRILVRISCQWPSCFCKVIIIMQQFVQMMMIGVVINLLCVVYSAWSFACAILSESKSLVVASIISQKWAKNFKPHTVFISNFKVFHFRFSTPDYFN